MKVENATRLMIGTVMFSSALASIYVDPAWIYLTLFGTFMTAQSAFTNFCPAVHVVKALGAKN